MFCKNVHIFAFYADIQETVYFIHGDSVIPTLGIYAVFIHNFTIPYQGISTTTTLIEFITIRVLSCQLYKFCIKDNENI